MKKNSNFSDTEYTTITLEKNSSFEITNTTTSTIIIRSDISSSKNNSYDSIVYTSTGQIVSVKFEERSSAYVDVGRKIKLSLNSGSVTLSVPKAVANTIVKVNTPALEHLTIKNGETYEFTNTRLDGSNLNLRSNYDAKSHGVNSISYNPNNNFYTMSNLDNVSFITLSRLYKKKLTLETGKELKVFIPYEGRGCIKKSETPTFDIVNIKLGETYEFTHSNIDNKTIKFITESTFSNNLRYESISYDANNNSKRMKYDYFLNDCSLNRGDREKITFASGGDQMKVYVPYEYKSISKKSLTPALHSIQINKNESYEFINNNTDGKTIQLISKNISKDNLNLDYIRFKINNEVYSLGHNKEYIDTDIMRGEKVKLGLYSGYNSMTVLLPYEYKDCYKKSTTPVFERIKIAKGETYSFKNNSNITMPVLTTTSSSSIEKYDYIIKNSNGSIYDSNVNDYGDLNLKPGMNMNLTLSSGFDRTIYIPYEYKNSYSKETNPVFIKELYDTNKSFEISNPTDYTYRIFNDSNSGKKYSITVTNSDGSIASSSTSTYGKFDLKKAQTAKITVLSSTSITFNIPCEIRHPKANKFDVNKDSKVDLLDLTCIASQYNYKKSTSGFNSNYDLNSDEIIDIFDLVLIAKEIK